MKYGEAFQKLGYTLVAPRSDWTAQREEGVCLTLWRAQIDWSASPITMSTRLHGRSPSEWSIAGNNKRKLHLGYAIDHLDGWVDVIVVDGIPGGGVTKATPWNVRERKARWRVRDLEPETGHFVAEAFPIL